ncbi:hypothetical protein BBJ28_00006816 [Nothophytophthora sp. Chile5]|nr:hypothetical protein BBJ28_00006816 [Nothophytophthora sp. Chile5]
MKKGDVSWRSKQRAFLDAAADGNLAAVDTWLEGRDDGKGDVNATMGEGWTALQYAVAHARLAIVQRLLQESAIDLNATTM